MLLSELLHSTYHPASFIAAALAWSGKIQIIPPMDSGIVAALLADMTLVRMRILTK